MRYFVSYARQDHTLDQLRIMGERLQGANSIYIDDLENHGKATDRVRIVVDALTRADIFLAVHSTHYLRTEWTRWELDKALSEGLEVIALLPSGEQVRWGSPQWPWPVSRVDSDAAVAS